jgi:ethanolamine ammonia-lyase large subunit
VSRNSRKSPTVRCPIRAKAAASWVSRISRLAGLAAESAEECVAARWCLAEVPLAEILARPLMSSAS